MKLASRIVTILIIVFLIVTCNRKESSGQDETILTGKVTIGVDETLTPIVQDQVEVFVSEYNAEINIVAKSETEVIQSLIKDSIKVAIIARELNESERKVFASKKIVPRVSKFATDAIAFIANRKSADSLIALTDVVQFLNGTGNDKIKGLVFDNPNSSSVRQLLDLANLTSIPETGVYSFNTNEEVIKFVSENNGMIGVVGLNWLSQPSPEMRQIVSVVQILSVKGLSGEEYIFPSQNNLAEGKYALARDLYFVNVQGFTGLGMGFGSFIAGERGQRIILRSGLLPVRMPSRKLNIRNNIESENK